MAGKIEIPIEVYQEMKNEIANKDEIITLLSHDNSELNGKFDDLRAKAIDLVSSSLCDRIFRWHENVKGIKKYNYNGGKN